MLMTVAKCLIEVVRHPGDSRAGDQAKRDLPFAFPDVARSAGPGIGSAGRTGGISAYLARVPTVSLTVGLVPAAAGRSTAVRSGSDRPSVPHPDRGRQE